MLRVFSAICVALFSVTAATAQTDALKKIVDTEIAFAALAAEKGNKVAFLANLTDDAVIFLPEKSNAKEYWTARTPGNGLLSWAPNYADVSANGVMGYTTGNWEFRPTGKSGEATGFGEFITIWQRQPDGSYKWVVDIGLDHPKPAKYSTEWSTSSASTRDPNAKRLSAADAAQGFLSAVQHGNTKKAYEQFAAGDIRLYREGKMPFFGKQAALAQIAAEKGTLALAEKSSFFGAADLAYSLSTYTRTDAGKVVEKGNYLQIWKLVGGKWLIVLDIFKPVPEK